MSSVKLALQYGFNKGLADFDMSELNPGPTVEETALLPVIAVKGTPVRIELAITPEQQQMGLMYRKKLNDNHGMLFVYPSEQYLSFWMKNTELPLAVAFIDNEGLIVDIQKMEPLDENSYRAIVPARFALEMPQNWFDNKGISVGDQVNI